MFTKFRVKRWARTRNAGKHVAKHDLSCVASLHKMTGGRVEILPTNCKIEKDFKEKYRNTISCARIKCIFQKHPSRRQC
ncbi:protein of unknown function [endosymbiont DhMRE of Dentiscutata heterogama]|nr:protein of unknown function [endosymbiont DhMRE of Dentiscutata heterogama]